MIWERIGEVAGLVVVLGAVWLNFSNLVWRQPKDLRQPRFRPKK